MSVTPWYGVCDWHQAADTFAGARFTAMPDNHMIDGARGIDYRQWSARN